MPEDGILGLTPNGVIVYRPLLASTMPNSIGADRGIAASDIVGLSLESMGIDGDLRSLLAGGGALDVTGVGSAVLVAAVLEHGVALIAGVCDEAKAKGGVEAHGECAQGGKGVGDDGVGGLDGEPDDDEAAAEANVGGLIAEALRVDHAADGEADDGQAQVEGGDDDQLLAQGHLEVPDLVEWEGHQEKLGDDVKDSECDPSRGLHDMVRGE